MTLAPTTRQPRAETTESVQVLIKEAHARRRRRRVGNSLIGVAVMAAVLAASAAVSLDRSVTLSTTNSPVRAVVAGWPRCGAAQLRMSGVPANGAGVSGGWVVRLRNASAHACSLSGYASVRGINHWNGEVLTARQTRNSYLGGWNSPQPLPTVFLRPGVGTASFLVSFVTGNDYRGCPYVTTLRIIIPPSTVAFTLTSSLQVCKFFSVQPLVPGVTGTSH